MLIKKECMDHDYKGLVKIYEVPGPGPEAGGQGLFLGKNMTG